jgi:hypothetical protein
VPRKPPDPAARKAGRFVTVTATRVFTRTTQVTVVVRAKDSPAAVRRKARAALAHVLEWDEASVGDVTFEYDDPYPRS